MLHQTLGFTIRVARSREDLATACFVRDACYGKHLPHLKGGQLLQPDLVDVSDHTMVVLCTDKQTGRPLGTARFQSNRQMPLMIEHCIDLPEEMQSDSMCEISKFAVMQATDPLVKVSIMKASHLYCLVNQIRWMVIGARSESLAKQYKALGFEALRQGGVAVPLPYAGNIHHQVLKFNATTAERIWKERSHGLYSFMFDTLHPDIDITTTETARQSVFAPKLARRNHLGARASLPEPRPMAMAA